MRAAKRNHHVKLKNMRLYESVERMLNDECPDWLETALPLGNRETLSVKNAEALVTWVHKHKRFPVETKGTPPEETRLSRWMKRMRMARKGSSAFNRVLHDSVAAILDEQLPGWDAPKLKKVPFP